MTGSAGLLARRVCLRHVQDNMNNHHIQEVKCIECPAVANN
jgi:hypothetical protein